MTYYDRLMEVLTGEIISFPEIMNRMNLAKYKQTYVIDAIKKG